MCSMSSCAVGLADIDTVISKFRYYSPKEMSPLLSTKTVPVDDILNVCKRKRGNDMKPINRSIKSEDSEEDSSPEKPRRKIVKIFPTSKKKRKDESDEENSEDSDDQKGESQEKPQKKVVKILSTPKKKCKDGSGEGDSEDSDYEIHEVGKKRNHIKKENAIKKTVKEEEKSAYEKMIEENKAQKMAFLQALKIDEVKAGFSDIVDNMKKTVKKTSQPVKRVVKKKETLLPVRKSLRLANVNIDLSEDSIYMRALKESKELEKIGISYQKPPLPAEMSFEEAIESKEVYESYTEDICIKKSESSEEYFLYDRSVIKNLTLKESNIAKVTPERITTLAWYPSKEYFILAAGSKRGNIGIWNVDSDSNPHLFHVHNEGTTHVQFNPYNTVQMFSSSYEGTLRCGDLIKNVFNEVYNISEETSCLYFDFLSATTYIVAQRDGDVVLVDKRSDKQSEKKHTCHNYAVKTVNIHPVDKNIFLTAENKGSVRLWDLRKLQKSPIADITHHKRCVNSAYFSPVSGNSILTTSFDDSVCIFDSTNLTEDIKLTKRIKHENNTGRWLSIFRATWAPNSDEIFTIGSLAYPRKIQIFDKELNAYCTVMHENLTTITSCNAFHPYRHSLAGANSSGKVFVFT